MATPDQIHGHMLDELRRHALAADWSRRSARLRTRWRALRARMPSGGQLALIGLAVVLFLGWAAVMVVHWPPGGGRHISGLVYTQGASLIFVVILLSLLNGPLTAGQKLGWDSGWIGRDSITWAGLAGVAILSLLLMWLGWVKPERPEAGASILLTAAGLVLTALIARRLVYLADPGNQLDARMDAQLPKVLKIMRRRQRQVARAIKRSTVPKVAETLELYPGSEIQEAIRGILRQFHLVTQRCCHEGNWDLALRAHAANVRLVKSYVSEAGALRTDDYVVTAFAEGSDALHEVSGGPAARIFSEYLLTGMKEVGLAVAARQHAAGLHAFLGAGTDSGPLFGIGFRVERMLKRRIADQDSVDPAYSVRVLGDLAAAAIQIGDAWNAIGVQERLLAYAPSATQAGWPHLAGPLWEEGIRILAGIAVVEAPADDHAFSAAGDKLTESIGAVPYFPRPIAISGFEPITGLVLARDKVSLGQAGYWIWESQTVEIHRLQEWTWGLTLALGGLLERTTVEAAKEEDGNHLLHWPSRELSNAIHQLVLAAASRAVDEMPDGRREIVDLIARQLAVLRGFIIEGDEVHEDRAINEIWHCYVTDFIVALYTTRTEELPGALADELAKLDERVKPTITSYLPGTFSRGMEALATAFERSGSEVQAGVATDLAERTTVRDRSRVPLDWDPFGEGFRLHRGNLIPPIIENAEDWLREGAMATADPATQG